MATKNDNATWEAALTFSDTATFPTEFSGGDTFNTTIDQINDDATWEASLTFDDTATFPTEFSDGDTFNTTMDQIVEVTTSDHRKLTHRDAEAQHPIASITNLTPELSVRPSAALSNQEIQDILNA